MQRWQKLGIVAGGGALPLRIASACQRSGNPFHVIALKGYADPEIAAFHPAECSIAEIGRLIRILKDSDCDAVVMAGIVRRPDFSSLKPDWRGAALLPKVLAAARKGDGAILDVVVQVFESEGFIVVGAEEAAHDLFAEAGPAGSCVPGDADFRDMAKAAALIRALGPFDIGQGAVVRSGLVLAVEAAEGTDEMLARCATLPMEVKGFEPGEEAGRRGVLLKRPKPGQELRVDLPTIGVETVRGAAAAGLAGIAVEAEAALIIDRERVAEAADAAGIFVYGFSSDELTHVDD